MPFAFSSSFHLETSTHTPFRITLCRFWIVLSCSWLKIGPLLFRNSAAEGRAIALSYALLISMECNWFAYLVNHLNSVECTLKISDLVKKEIFQHLTLNSQYALLDDRKCELQLSIIRIFTMHHIFITAFFLTLYKIWCIWSPVGQILSFWKQRILVGKETFRIYKNAIITMIWHRYSERNRSTTAREYLKEYSDAQHQCQ